MRFHASCVARLGADGYDAVLLCGPSGCGKSDLLLRLVDYGWALVADDQVQVTDGVASAPAPLTGVVEVRGLGLFRLDHLPEATLRLVVHLGEPAARLPEPTRNTALGLPEVTIEPFAASAPARLSLALDAATGRVTQIAGAFAA
jgi:HPr kinase/phosphorylase